MLNKDRSRNEIFSALHLLAEADYGIGRLDNANINFECWVPRCYALSCGYFVTNIGIFDSRREKIDLGKKNEKELYRFVEEKYNSLHSNRKIVASAKLRIRKNSH